MGVTIQTPSISTAIPQVIAPFVQVKETWSGTWQTAPQLLVTQLTTASAGQDMSRLVFHRRYGYVKDTYEADFQTRIGADLTDWWIRVRALSDDATTLRTAWLGRISGDDVARFASSDVPAGIQQWVAYGPADILRKRAIGSSFHFRPTAGGELQELGWIPPLNDPKKSEVGNRSANKSGGAYVYGGTDLWSYRDYAEYLLTNFLDESTDNGPEWQLAGATGILADFKVPIQWGTTHTAYEMLRTLIPLDRGIDYTVRIIESRTPSEGPDIPEAGFEVYIYATSAVQYNFAGFAFPVNPTSVILDAGNAKDLSPPPRIVVSNDRKYKRIRVLGKRIVVCCSLWAANAPNVAQVDESTIGVPPRTADTESSLPSLVNKWDDAIEAQYKTSVGAKSEDEADHDAYRRQDKFRDVYASFGAPDDWDMNGGTANVWVDSIGKLIQFDDPDTEEDERQAPYQLVIRKTLPWIPLKEGEDWTNIAQEATGARGLITFVDNHQPDYLPPIAWLFDPGTYSYLNSDKLGIGVSPKRHDWGVLLRCSPNHIMGNNHFGNEGETSLITATWPRFDWKDLAVTIAFESDQRYTMEWAHPDATAKDGIYEVSVDAELHYLAPNTIVASPYPDSTPAVVLSGDEGRVIREDRELMGLTMAGALSRYGYGRPRASVSVKGLVHWHDLIGQILTTVQESGNSHDINGPISDVTWDMPPNGSPNTIIRAGYAS